jgi:hypothetical protein
MMASYTDLARVKAYGDVSTTGDDSLIEDTLIPGYSEQVATFCRQRFELLSYSAQHLRGYVDPDGLLMCYPAVPTMTAPTSAAFRYGSQTAWTTITAEVDLETAEHGCTLRWLGDYEIYRGQNIRIQLDYTGGYADVDSMPAGFVTAVTRLVWWAAKLREAPIETTAVPGLGQITIPPGKWPADILAALRPFRRWVML